MKCIIEASSIKLMIEGKEKDLTKKMKYIKDAGEKLEVIIPISHLLRGIWTANPTSNIQNLQKILSFSKIAYDLHANFKNEEETTNELLNLMKYMGQAQKLRKKYKNITQEELFKKMKEENEN